MIAMARVNIFLQDELLAAADAEAKDAGMKRSALFREALKEYLERRKRDREERALRRRREKAFQGIDRLAGKFGNWGGVGIIREARETPRWKKKGSDK